MSGLPNGGLRAEFPRYCHMAEDVSGRNIHTGVPTQSPPRAEIRVSLNLKSLIFLSYFNKNWNASTYFSKKNFFNGNSFCCHMRKDGQTKYVEEFLQRFTVKCDENRAKLAKHLKPGLLIYWI